MDSWKTGSAGPPGRVGYITSWGPGFLASYTDFRDVSPHWQNLPSWFTSAGISNIMRSHYWGITLLYRKGSSDQLSINLEEQYRIHLGGPSDT